RRAGCVCFDLAGLHEPRPGRALGAGAAFRVDPAVVQPVLHDSDLEHAARHGVLTPSGRGPARSGAAPNKRTASRPQSAGGSVPSGGTGTAGPGEPRSLSPAGSGSFRSQLLPGAVGPPSRPNCSSSVSPWPSSPPNSANESQCQLATT